MAANGTFDISATTSGASIQTLSGTGGVSLGGKTLTLANASGLFSGAIAGSGGLILSGGTQMLTGTNTYVGGTTITSGKLQIGTGGTSGSIVGNITNGGSVGFARSDSLIYSGVISGSGQMQQTGVGTTILTGTNTYNGGTTIASGSLQIGAGGTTGSIAGNVSNNGTLIFDRSDTLTYAGTIAGSGQLLKEGAGKTILSGTSTYTGATVIQSGTLSVNGSIAGSSGVMVDSGATLGGSGRVASTTILSGGTLAPGNSIATLSSVGTLTLMSGATTVIEIDDISADRFSTTGAVVLSGTLQVVPFGIPAPGPFPVGTGRTIFDGALGVTGAFTSVTQPSTGLLARTRFDTVYRPTLVDLYVTPVSYTDLSSSNITLNAGQRAVGSAIDRIRSAAGTRLSGASASLFDAFYPLTAPQIAVALSQLTGEIHTAAAPLAARSSGLFLNAMLDPFAAGRGLAPTTVGMPVTGGSLQLAGARDAVLARDAKPYSVWGAALVGGGYADGNLRNGSTRRSDRISGGAAGVDMAFGSSTILGFGAGDTDAAASLSNGLGSLDANSFHSGIYGTTKVGRFSFAGAAAYSQMDVETNRSMSLFGMSSVRSSYQVPVWSGRIQAAYEGAAFSGFLFAPYLSLEATTARMPGFQERNGATGAAVGVSGDARTGTTSQTELGLKVTRNMRVVGVNVKGFGAFLNQ